MIKLSSLLVLLMIAFSSNAQEEKKRGNKPTVPVLINISADETSIGYIDVPIYSAQVLSELNKSQEVNFVMTGSDQKPEIIINVNVTNLIIGQRMQRSATRPGRHIQVVGTDSRGRSITRVVDVIVEELTVERSTSTTFNASIKVMDDTSPLLNESFNSLYNYKQTTSNSPERRTIRAESLLSTKVMPEPRTEEYLFLMTKKDLTPYLTSELRKIYGRKDQTARVN